MVSKHCGTEKDARETKPNQRRPLLLSCPSLKVYCFCKTGEESRRVGSSLLSLLGASMGISHACASPQAHPTSSPCCDKCQPTPACRERDFGLNFYFSSSVREAGAGTQSRYLEAGTEVEAMEKHCTGLLPVTCSVCFLVTPRTRVDRRERDPH